ncbi:MAG TPA: XdhC/CoxI family protein [Actinospica sp.]|nr:XdhC/CoxI family protein [Actinospica sp.]
MSDLTDRIGAWHTAGHPYALASIVDVRGSTPLDLGPALAVDGQGRAVGSVSGGCVDAAVYDLCLRVLGSASDGPLRETYSETDEDDLAPTLVCGGAITIEARRVDPRLEGPPMPDPTDPPRLIVFGAVAFTDALVKLGRLLDYHVTVCDARPVFATRERYPWADEVVVSWPHKYLVETPVDHRTAVCVLTHDERFDLPVLEEALRMPVGYVGAIGSRRTCAQRRARLEALGVPPEHLARLRAPIGLDLGAHTPEEVAVSILAEIIAASRGGSGRPLTQTEGPLHHGDTPRAGM